jgi:hypothetical protein
MLTLQDKIESFFSKAEIIQSKSEGDLTVMNIIFGKKSFKHFSNMTKHQNVIEYFKGRSIKMIIDENSAKRTFSLVDTLSGDTLNIENVKFTSGNFEHFLDTVPSDRQIQIFMAGLSGDGSTMVMCPPNPDYGALKIHGYSYIKKK